MAKLSPEWEAYCAECAARAPRIWADLAALKAFQQEVTMSMADAAENNLPHDLSDGAHTGLRLAGDVGRRVAALLRQLDEANAYIADLEADRARVRHACAAGQQAAYNRIAQGSPDSARWAGQAEAYAAIAALIPPAE